MQDAAADRGGARVGVVSRENPLTAAGLGQLDRRGYLQVDLIGDDGPNVAVGDVASAERERSRRGGVVTLVVGVEPSIVVWIRSSAASRAILRVEHERSAAVVGDRGSARRRGGGAGTDGDVLVGRLPCAGVDDRAGLSPIANLDGQVSGAERAGVADIFEAVDRRRPHKHLHLPGEHVLAAQEQRAASATLPEDSPRRILADHAADDQIMHEAAEARRVDERAVGRGEHKVVLDLIGHADGIRRRGIREADISVERDRAAREHELPVLAGRAVVGELNSGRVADDVRHHRRDRVVERRGFVGAREGERVGARRQRRRGPVGRVGPERRGSPTGPGSGKLGVRRTCEKQRRRRDGHDPLPRTHTHTP